MSNKRAIGMLLFTSAAAFLLAGQLSPAAAAAPHALNPGIAPGGNFNLSRWELQLPTGTTDHTTTISPTQLEGANGYQSKFFFTNKTDGSMSFWNPENGVTLGSKFPRTELREMTASGTEIEWSIPGTHMLSATLKATVLPDHVAVGQIHLDNSSGSSKPLLELFYYKNGNVDLAIEQTPAGGNEVHHVVGNVPLGTKFSYVISLTNSNTIGINLNGTNHTFTMPSAFNGIKMYFKAGDYDQSFGSSSTIGARVQFYALSVFHGA